jgi:hypothetical protein
MIFVEKKKKEGGIAGFSGGGGGGETCRTDFGQKSLRDELKGVEINHRRVLNNLKIIVFGRD